MAVLALVATIGTHPEPTVQSLLQCIQEILANLNTMKNNEDQRREKKGMYMRKEEEKKVFENNKTIIS